MTIVPHFTFPFHVGLNGTADVLEQDTLDDVAQCVEVVLLTREGERLEVPGFGTRDIVFETRINTSELIAAVQQWEPRVIVMMSEAPDMFDTMVRNIQVTASSPGRSTAASARSL